MSKSTSFHQFSADKGLNRLEKPVWKLLNTININFFPNSSADLDIRNFSPVINPQDWEISNLKASPGRTLSNLFWHKVDWPKVKEAIGGIKIFDSGAGSGNYGLRINEFAGGVEKYVGTDLNPKESWDALMEENPFITMKASNSNDISELIPPDTNLFFSQSAIEHFKEDLVYFSQLLRFIQNAKHEVLQLHLFPSASCLKTYGFHGVRQYTPRMVSKITKMFESEKSYSILYQLGGENSINLHLKYITNPKKKTGKDLRQSKEEEYTKLLKEAIIKDIEAQDDKACFYALVIHSNYSQPIFKEMKSLTKNITT